MHAHNVLVARYTYLASLVVSWLGGLSAVCHCLPTKVDLAGWFLDDGTLLLMLHSTGDIHHTRWLLGQEIRRAYRSLPELVKCSIGCGPEEAHSADNPHKGDRQNVRLIIISVH